ncbi:MAG: DUF5686 family protein, partial [Bacteroidales bacterium]|nr:DUF5686 family protein [Bacteroidales bacterium]
MPDRLLTCFLLFFFSLPCLAQLKGRVVDASTNEPIAYANVYYEGKGVGTASNQEGNFTIEAHADWTQLTISYVGYEVKIVDVSADMQYLGDIPLKSLELDEVIVKPKREKYSRKNNPAVELMKKVVAHKQLNDLSVNDYYSYNIYRKITFALNNITADSLRESKIFQKYPFFRNQVELCEETGKNILPISVEETLTQKAFRKNPRSEKNIIKGINSSGVNDMFNTGDIMTTVIKDVFTDVNVYDDHCRLLQFSFDSPISDNGIAFYRYFIMDTVYVQQDKCIHLSFVPNNSRDVGFTGHLYVLADSTYRVKHCTLNLPKKTGVNYVTDLTIRQEFEGLPSGEWVQKADDMICEMNFFGMKMMVRRTTRNQDHSFEEIPKQIFKVKGSEVKDVNAMMRDDDFWQEYRAVDLTKSESSMDDFVQNLTKIKGFEYIVFVAKAFIENFVETGSKNTPSKVDIGPVNTMISQNYIDGLRLRASAQTTANLNPHWFFKGYYAHGFRDHKSKGMAQVEYSFKKKEYLSREFPKHTLAVAYQYDNMSPSDKFLRTDKDNVFTSFKTVTVDQFNYERNFRIEYEHERLSGLKTGFVLKHSNYEPCGKLFYQTVGGREIPDFSIAEATVSLRYAPGETFVNTKQRRLPINLDAPVFSLAHTFGVKGVFGSNYNYNFTDASIHKRFWFASWGNFDVNLKGGIQWNKVPFPLLIMPAANLSYIIEEETFNLINNMEFLNDRFASLDMSWNLQGKIFNRIPLLKYLKWREFIGVKCLWGSISDKNNPFLPQNASDDMLMVFPGRYSSEGTMEYHYSSFVMDP